jgi:tetratricopeptide (TPR) repeat protein
MGNVRQAQSAANELLAFARERSDAAAEAMAHRALGDSLIHVGDLRSANAHLKEALRILGPLSPPLFVGEDVRTAALVFLSLCLALQGHVSAAEERLQEAIARARSLDHTFTVAFVLNNACRIKCHLLDYQGLVQNLDRLQALATEHRIKFMQQNADIFRGWAMLLNGRIKEGGAILKSYIEGDMAIRAQKNVPFHGAMLATAYQRTGRVEDGLKLIRSLLKMVEQSGNRYVEAELFRVKAELLLSSARIADAEEALQRGLAIARQQQARIYEMRIATTLAKTWRDQGQSAKAHSVLAPICESFGRVSLRDLEDAHEVLHHLNKRALPTVALR